LANTKEFPESFRGNHAVGSDGRGGVWVGNAQRLWHWDGEHFEASAARIPLLVSSVCRDRQGRNWICLGGGGALCWDGSEFHALTPDDGLAHGTVTRVHEDHEGLLWFTTWGGGVSCYDPVSLRRCGSPAELPAREVQALTQDTMAQVWLGC
jgi:ligand-binding sensor domain-containing protein